MANPGPEDRSDEKPDYGLISAGNPMTIPGIERALRKIPDAAVVLGALILLGLIAWADYADGYYMSFSLFYLLPIILVAAKTGKRGGIASAVLASVILFVIEDSLRPGEMRFYALIWNTVLRFGFFLIIVLAQSAIQQALLKVESTNLRLASANSELAEANEQLDAFSRASAHDLRSPLLVIKGFADRLIRRHGGRPGGEVRRSLECISSSAEQMGDLLNAMLAFARAGKAEIERAEVELGPLAEQIADRLRARDPGRRAEFHIEPGIVASVDPHLVFVVLDNLLGNAWKFSAERDRTVIEFGVVKPTFDGRPPVFFVRDNGVGFDMTAADRLFTPFTRLHSASRFEGSGIGLSTVRKIIDRHGGRIWAESAPDRGATFYFTLAAEDG